MNDQTSEIELLQRIYIDVNANPIRISYGTIQHITKNFAQEIGTGGYGVVYLGALKNGMVAVKKLSLGPSMDFEQQFMDEWPESVLDVDNPMIKNCVQIAQMCVDKNPDNRPTIDQIIYNMNETETLIENDPPIIVELRNDPNSPFYQGIGSVAVKRLSWPHSSDELKFRQEVKSTSIAQHRNVVRFLGHCSYTEEKEVEYNGKIVPAAVLEKLLCFEYLSNGSLNHYLSGML
ncbi:hypothetical protein PR202_ga27537 [Eleusine coracana subsp. coracana]|uniref:Protein kinase domain-containing protein n=1 Tax=Eleusine coracana subsp. coracana TaxID=191504 RepID=A0AAV5DHE1_ELECO|nr:hypothetical protein PR202_ga27537 [Eleusine coracana subsp. coracana]